MEADGAGGSLLGVQLRLQQRLKTVDEQPLQVGVSTASWEINLLWKIDTVELSSQHHPPLWKRMEPESPCSASSSASSSASKPFTSSHSRSASAPPRSARRRSLRFSLSNTFWLDVVTLQQKYYDINGLFEMMIPERNVLAVPPRCARRRPLRFSLFGTFWLEVHHAAAPPER